MRKASILLLCLAFFITVSCDNSQNKISSEPESISEPISKNTASTSSTQSVASSETPITSTEENIGPINTATIYSSYANMVSFDATQGWADFDYFNMLKGDEAIQYLIDIEGYTLENAKKMVDDFSDSEFINQNENSQLRTINLQKIDLKLMYKPDGTAVTDAISIDATFSDLYELYNVNPDLVLNSFFYYIKVINDEIISVEQVYWP